MTFDIAGQLKWFQNTLQQVIILCLPFICGLFIVSFFHQARTNGEKVFVMAHIPPGNGDFRNGKKIVTKNKTRTKNTTKVHKKKKTNKQTNRLRRIIRQYDK
jgi:hypothetical protein